MNKMPTETMTGPEAEAEDTPKVKRKRLKIAPKSVLRPLLLLLVPALLLIGGGYYWLTSGGEVSTDDAQVKQDIVSVSAQVNGPIVQVFVRDGTKVTRGQLLFRIDPQPFRVHPASGLLFTGAFGLLGARGQCGDVRVPVADGEPGEQCHRDQGGLQHDPAAERAERIEHGRGRGQHDQCGRRRQRRPASRQRHGRRIQRDERRQQYGAVHIAKRGVRGDGRDRDRQHRHRMSTTPEQHQRRDRDEQIRLPWWGRRDVSVHHLVARLEGMGLADRPENRQHRHECGDQRVIDRRW